MGKNKINKKFVLECFAVTLFIAVLIISNVCTSNEYNNADLAVVKAYVLNDVKLTDSQIKRLDINKDGHISSMDYVLIKNKLIKKDVPTATN